MADKKGKPVTPIKTLSKKEQEELKKKVRMLGMLQYVCMYDLVTLDILTFSQHFVL